MTIGRYELKIIESGYFSLDGGAMFGIVPKPLWERTNPPDSSNRILLATRNLLLMGNGKKILVDTGMGNKWDDKSKNIYAVDQQNVSLFKSLEANSTSPEEITDVLLTHLHFDHTGGSTIIKNGKLIPAFPNAKYHVQKKNFEWGVNPSERDRGSYLKENFLPLKEEGVLNLLDGEKNFDDEIELILINGHTFAQQLIKISDASNQFLYCCDLFPTTSHISLPYIMGYDLQPLVTLEEKKKILARAVEENWTLIFEHDPDSAAATVAQTERGIQIKEKFRELK